VEKPIPSFVLSGFFYHAENCHPYESAAWVGAQPSFQPVGTGQAKLQEIRSLDDHWLDNPIRQVPCSKAVQQSSDNQHF